MTLVIKVGGTLLKDPSCCQSLFQSIAQLVQNRPVILVHGGGALVETWLAERGLHSDKINGLRVTTSEQLPYVVGALAGAANKQLVATALSQGISSVGISLFDGGTVQCESRGAIYGAVGKAEAGDPKLLSSLLEQEFLPIVSSIGATANGQLLNVNADEAATALAKMFGAELLLLSDVPGVMDAKGDLLEQLTAAQIGQLIEDGTIYGGMQVKVSEALITANQLNQNVVIAGWKQAGQLAELNTNKGLGTKIIPDCKAGVEYEA